MELWHGGPGGKIAWHKNRRFGFANGPSRWSESAQLKSRDAHGCENELYFLTRYSTLKCYVTNMNKIFFSFFSILINQQTISKLTTKFYSKSKDISAYFHSHNIHLCASLEMRVRVPERWAGEIVWEWVRYLITSALKSYLFCLLSLVSHFGF